MSTKPRHAQPSFHGACQTRLANNTDRMRGVRNKPPNALVFGCEERANTSGKRSYCWITEELRSFIHANILPHSALPIREIVDSAYFFIAHFLIQAVGRGVELKYAQFNP